MRDTNVKLGLIAAGEKIEPTLESLTVTENGIYTPDEGVDGFNEVEVNVNAKEDPNKVLWIMNPEELAIYDLSDTTMYNEARRVFLIPGFVFGSQITTHPAALIQTTRDETYHYCLRRDGWYHVSYAFYKIIPPGKYTKLRIYAYCSYDNLVDNYWILYLYKAGTSTSGDSFYKFYPSPNGYSLSTQTDQLLREVTLLSRYVSDETINTQTGVTINVGNKILPLQEIVVDISEYTDPIIVAFRDCDVWMEMYYIKVTAD